MNTTPRPQIIAGIISVPLLYGLVKRYFGVTAGLIAAFAQALSRHCGVWSREWRRCLQRAGQLSVHGIVREADVIP